jgi:hypothetical protein
MQCIKQPFLPSGKLTHGNIGQAEPIHREVCMISIELFHDVLHDVLVVSLLVRLA